MTTAPTIVVYRRCKTTGQVVALFPYVRKGYGLCDSYTHAGQHAVVDYKQMLSTTTAANPLLQQDVRQLVQELVTLPERYQLQTMAAEAILVEREGLGEQMNLFILPNPVAAQPQPQRSRVSTQRVGSTRHLAKAA